MSRGGGDPYLRNVRAAVEADKALPPVPISPVNWAGQTPNHLEDLIVGNYALNQEAGRPALIDWFNRQLHTSGLNARTASGVGSEILSTSHEAHYLSSRGSALYLALRNRDEAALAVVSELVGRELCLMNILCNPKSGCIVGAHGRSTFDPKGRDPSDQRVQMKTWRQALMGLWWREPKTLETSDDWLGLFAIKKASTLPRYEAMLHRIQSFQGVDGLPVTHDKYLIRSGPHGVVSCFADEKLWPKMPGAALWASSDFRSPVVQHNRGNTPDELYGFEGPVPDCPGGATKEYKLPWIGGKW